MLLILVIYTTETYWWLINTTNGLGSKTLSSITRYTPQWDNATCPKYVSHFHCRLYFDEKADVLTDKNKRSVIRYTHT